MPPEHNAGPPCPACLSPDTERLPFTSDGPTSPVYACEECGHVWRQPTPAAIERNRRTEAHNG